MRIVCVYVCVSVRKRESVCVRAEWHEMGLEVGAPHFASLDDPVCTCMCV